MRRREKEGSRKEDKSANLFIGPTLYAGLYKKNMQILKAWDKDVQLDTHFTYSYVTYSHHFFFFRTKQWKNIGTFKNLKFC